MMPKRSLNPKEIIRLLSKLKEGTPEYPANLLEARKAALLKQAAALKIQGKGQGGEGGGEGGSGGSGGSGPALGGGTAAQGILLQALIAFSLIAAMLTAFAYREQISEVLGENEVVTVERTTGETATLSGLSTPTAIATVTPGLSASPTQVIPTGTITGLEGTVPVVNGTPLVMKTPDGTKTNSGLHLGQTPGTPAAPGHGNPGNDNKPDKPDKPKKPRKK